jgi:hypothetical protein
LAGVILALFGCAASMPVVAGVLAWSSVSVRLLLGASR